jgi:hypothetical protein
MRQAKKVYEQGERTFEKAYAPVIKKQSEWYQDITGITPEAATGGGVIIPSHDTQSISRVPGLRGHAMLAYVHGGETIRNPAHEDRIVGAINSLAAQLSGGGGQPIVVQSMLTLDGREIARSTTTNQRLQRTGVSIPQTVGMRR